jgi:HK97 family phage major capsid protein
MTTTTAQKDLVDKSLQCINLARTIQARYPDLTKIPAEHAQKVNDLLKEARRLKGLADMKKQQDEMEAWAAEPDRVPAALAADAAVAAKVGGEPFFTEASKRREQELFAKALRQQRTDGKGWKNASWVAGLDVAEKAQLIEDATGELLVPHDLAGPIFKALPRLAVFRSAGPTVRTTNSDKVDLRSIVGGTYGWGRLETGGTPPADALGATPAAADTVSVWDLYARAILGVDELADTDANLVALIQQNTGQLFAQAQDDAFANGTGVSQPWGLAMRATQATPMITQSVSASAPGTIKATELKSLQYRVPSRFRMNGAYFLSADSAEKTALIQDTTSNFIWQPSIRAGEPDTLFGKRAYTLEGLPTMAGTVGDDPSVIFGDPELGYLVADRQSISVQVLDQVYAEVGKVAYLFKMRVGGDIMRPLAFAKYLL